MQAGNRQEQARVRRGPATTFLGRGGTWKYRHHHRHARLGGMVDGGDTCTPTAMGLPLPGLSVTAGSLPAPALVFFFPFAGCLLGLMG